MRLTLLHRLFNRSNIDCPRCLGKGHVDLDDIRRLKKELIWIPGECAYCNGLGKVSSKMPSKVSVDNTYLTIELPKEEKNRIANNDPYALQRADLYNKEVNRLILEIEYLHFTGKLPPSIIADFYFLSNPKSILSLGEKNEFIEYIEKIIKHKTM